MSCMSTYSHDVYVCAGVFISQYQEMVCSNNHSNHLKELKFRLSDHRLSKKDAFRLVLIYALRYETHRGNGLMQLMDILHEQKGLSSSELKLLSSALQYAGTAQRNEGLFGENEGIGNFFQRLVSKGGLKEETNVFTQHKPLVSSIIDNAFKGKLKDNVYPFMSLTSREPCVVCLFHVLSLLCLRFN